MLVKALQIANGNYPWIAGAMVFNLDYAPSARYVAQNNSSTERYSFSLPNQDKRPRQAYNVVKAAHSSGKLP